MLESKFQANLVAELKRRFPGCIVMKNDANYIQGIPDILILYNDMWASLECKKSASAKKQPNQEYYVRRMNEMSFSKALLYLMMVYILANIKVECVCETRHYFQLMVMLDAH